MSVNNCCGLDTQTLGFVTSPVQFLKGNNNSNHDNRIFYNSHSLSNRMITFRMTRNLLIASYIIIQLLTIRLFCLKYLIKYQIKFIKSQAILNLILLCIYSVFNTLYYDISTYLQMLQYSGKMKLRGIGCYSFINIYTIDVIHKLLLFDYSCR